MDLYNISSSQLESFIGQQIEPDAAYLASCGAVVDRLVHFLQNNAPGRIRPAKVIKGGSLGKGTAVKGKSDIDLTLMLANYKEVHVLSREMRAILELLEDYLGKYGGSVKILGKTRHSVQVELSCHANHTHSVDILPAVDILPNLSMGKDSIKFELRWLYAAIGHQDRKAQSFYSASLGPLQIELTRPLPTKLKSLIRLVKYWKKEKLAPQTGEHLPTSYVLELVTLNAWMRAGKPEAFNMTRALHAVLTSLVNHLRFRVVFDGSLAFYDKAQPEKTPYIMDPCNPYNDVYHGYFRHAWDWDAVAKEASRWLGMNLFAGIRDTKVRW